MKNILLLLIIMSLTLRIEAQHIKDKWGEVVPFSLTDRYKDIVKTEQIHSLVLPSYDNDSLCRANNNGKSLNELGSTFAAGFCIDTLINFKENAQSFKLKEGTLWIYTIESPTANALSAIINDFDVSEGCYFSVIPGFMPYEINEPETYIYNEIPQRIKERGMNRSVDNTKIILELFEPNNVNNGRNYTINKICYRYAGGFGQALKKHMEEIKDTIKLKSGFYEDPNDLPLPCQYDTEYTEVAYWKSEKNSVCYIRIEYTYQNITFINCGTGFFLNKQGGYSDSDQPVFVTCGHLFAPEVEPGIYYNISNNYNGIEIIIDYENKLRNDRNVRFGKPLPGLFNRIDLGLTYNPKEIDYSEDGDYSIFQTSKQVGKLSKYNILYAGWDANPNYIEEGYAAIGHPKSSVKRINVENSRAWANSTYFGLYYDLGVNEHGCSGSPVFNYSKKIVGWVCTGNGDCNHVGMNVPANHTTCGKFNDLYLNILYLIDPDLQYESESSNPSPQTPPAHCNDCIQNYDETAIDCGGADCYPCGIRDVVTIKTPMDIPGSVKSRYEIFAEPDPNTLLALKGRSYSLEAGMNVYLKGGFVVEKGAEFYAGTNAELMSEADRGCGNYCVNAPSVEISPDGDGINDYWAFSQAFAVEYDLRIFDRNDHTYYSVNNQPILENGWIMAWDGSGADPNIITYFGILTLTDCNGNTHYEDFFITIRGLKSIEISEEANVLTEAKNVEATDAKIEVYPNPFSDNIIINYTGNTLPLEYKVMDLNGKVILHKNTSSNYETISLKSLAAGNYIISAKAGDYNLVQKLIKK